MEKLRKSKHFLTFNVQTQRVSFAYPFSESQIINSDYPRQHIWGHLLNH